MPSPFLLEYYQIGIQDARERACKVLPFNWDEECWISQKDIAATNVYNNMHVKLQCVMNMILPGCCRT